MAEAGILDEDERVELLEGRIVTMSPIGSRHFDVVNRLNRLFSRTLDVPALVSVQNPVRLGEEAEPEPDVALLRSRDDYAERLPTAEDVLLLVEVADTSLAADRSEKLPLYARCGVAEVWLVAVGSGENYIEVCRDPSPEEGYGFHQRHRRGETLTPAALPEAAASVGDVLGPRRSGTAD
jgi:Uma2 family endonuclease